MIPEKKEPLQPGMTSFNDQLDRGEPVLEQPALMIFQEKREKKNTLSKATVVS